MFPTRSSVVLHHATTTSLRLDFISVVNKAGFACHSRRHAFSVIIPDYQYTSHQAMVACLSPLTRLTELSLEFESDSPFPLLMKLTSGCVTTLSVIPALIYFKFQGVNAEYMEDLVARIGVPQLNFLRT